MNRTARVLALAWLAGACSLAWSADVVHFDDGRAMRVEGVDRGVEMTVLQLEGGGELAVPNHRITLWTRIEPQPVPTNPSGARWRSAAGPYAELIADAAERHGLEPALLTAMAQVESALDPGAISHKGASGLMQLMPDTAKRFGVVDVFDVAQNVEGGARYFSWLLARFSGRTDLALAGYNAGEGSVDQYQGIPPYGETQRYVDRVLSRAERLGAAPR
jgi:soluble lytic murein transglycosylase-like protein